MPDTRSETTEPLTVGGLIERLSAFARDRRVVFIDPDTEWRADVVVREPKGHELRDGEEHAPPVIVTGNPYEH